MTERVWDKYISERDRAVFDASGFGANAGFGKRPALLIIDVNYAFCGERSEPILDSIQKWRLSCGEAAWDAIPVIRRLIDAAHKNGLPVIFTTGQQDSSRWEMGSWLWKHPSQNDGDAEKTDGAAPSNRDGNEIVNEIKPGPTDIVVRKIKPSGFFEAPMMSYLTNFGADSLIVTGTTTSGCVRATAVDAFSNNFRVAVVEDGCFDRSEISHAVSLLDMHAKYADVVRSGDALEYMETLPADLFELPEPRDQSN